MQRRFLILRTIAFVILMALCITAQSKKFSYGPRDKAYYADPTTVEFVRPGLGITINSASISSAGAISVTYTLTDPSGLPLDAAGVNTPGAVSLTYFAAYIPKGQQQYVAYTTASANGANLGTVTRPTFEEGGGTVTPVGAAGPGQYRYVMKTVAPAGFDPTITTTIGISGSRDLTTFNLGTSYGGATYNFVPNGSAVTVTRDVIKTASCNTCHGQLAFHGGHAFGMEYCVMCHNLSLTDASTRAQSTNATILAQAPQALNFNFAVHRIHTGVNLAAMGASYIEITHNGRVDNFSNTLYPAMSPTGSTGNTQNCSMCHVNSSEQNLPDGENQVTNGQYYINPTPPVTSSCSGCHAAQADAAHFASNLNSIGEACDVCHNSGAQFSVGAVHAQ